LIERGYRIWDGNKRIGTFIVSSEVKIKYVPPHKNRGISFDRSRDRPTSKLQSLAASSLFFWYIL